MRLWEVCQTPDFRKATQDEHTRLVGMIFEHLTQGRRRLPEAWMREQYDEPRPRSTARSTPSRRDSRGCARSPMSPIAPTGSTTPRAGRSRARDLEDRLSDTLHERLIQRFVDRRTSVLLKTLNERPGELASQIEANGAVSVEGHFVGTLNGLAVRAGARRDRTREPRVAQRRRPRGRARDLAAISRPAPLRPRRLW